MAVFEPLDLERTDDVTYLFHCPGCKTCHYVRVKGKSGCVWEWNGSTYKPTVNPSILVCAHEPARRCHSFIKDGMIQYLDDCHHELKGQTIALPDMDLT